MKKAKLSEVDIAEIKRLYGLRRSGLDRDKKYTSEALARRYGVSSSYISKIVNAKTPRNKRAIPNNTIVDKIIVCYENENKSFKECGERVGLSKQQTNKIYRGQSRHIRGRRYSTEKMYRGKPVTEIEQRANIGFDKYSETGQYRSYEQVLGEQGVYSDIAGKTQRVFRGRKGNQRRPEKISRKGEAQFRVPPDFVSKIQQSEMKQAPRPSRVVSPKQSLAKASSKSKRRSPKARLAPSEDTLVRDTMRKYGVSRISADNWLKKDPKTRPARPK